MKTKQFSNGIKIVQFSNLLDNGIEHAIFSRQGGVSKGAYQSLNFGGTVGDDPVDVLDNHKIAFKTIGLPFAKRFDVWQVHGTDIVIADEARQEGSPHLPADGIITRSSQVSLLMRFADCVPVMVADPEKRIVGIYHAGWQGTVKGICEAFIRKLKTDFGSKPADLVVGIGPAICKDCYEVGDDLLAPFAQTFGDKLEEIIQRVDGRLHLDLWQANLIQLKACGVENVEVAGICTACHLGDWYSHRAEDGKTGRFGAVISLSKPEGGEK